MTWTEIARKDFADSVRSNTFFLLAGGFLFVTFALSSLQHVFGDPTFEAGVGAAFGTMAILVPIVAILLSYRSVVAERDSGSLHVLLSLPVTRRELLAGKATGRALALFVPVTIGFLLVIPFLYALYGSFAPSEYARFIVRALVNGVLYTVLGVAVSAAVGTTRRALAILGCLVVLVYFVVYTVPDVLYWLVHSETPETATTWMLFIEHLAPHEALENIIDAVWARELSTDAPLVLQEWVSVAVLALWFVVPIAIGYLRFRTSDII